MRPSHGTNDGLEQQKVAGSDLVRSISFVEPHTLAPTAQFVLGDPDATGHTVRSPGIQREVEQRAHPTFNAHLL